MHKTIIIVMLTLAVFLPGLAGCQAVSATDQAPAPLHVTAIETFLGDVTQNVAGSRARVDTLIPIGIDPHEFQPTPQDVVKLVQAQVIVANGAGLETWLQKTIANASGNALLVEASSGLNPLPAVVNETPPAAVSSGQASGAGTSSSMNNDPHFWLDPNNVIRYVQNIRAGLTQADPQGQDTYAQNAAAYITQLQALDDWIRQQVSAIPPERRVMVTNHDDFRYFAYRYNFQILGSIIPSFSTDSSPSAQQLAALVDKIKSTHAVAVFLEAGVNPQLADEIARETGVKVVTGLLTHSITAPGGPAPTYIDMLRYDVNAIVDALK